MKFLCFTASFWSFESEAGCLFEYCLQLAYPYIYTNIKKYERYRKRCNVREKRMFDTIIKLKEQIESGKYRPGKKSGQVKL